MENKGLVENTLLALQQAVTAAEKETLRTQLVSYVNDLLLNDFSGLVQMLYRVDVEEEKLKHLLRQAPETDAAVLITDLLIRRQAEKAATRAAFRGHRNIPGDESW